MATYKQKEANRANALSSTGPKSETGKSVSRMNACKHGLTAETIIIDGENPEEFNHLHAQLEKEFKPPPGLESDLVERLAVYIWRMRRVPVFEAALLGLGCERAASDKRKYRRLTPLRDPELKEVPFENIAIGLIENQAVLQNLSRYEAALLNAYNRTLQQLLVLQDRRARAEAENKVVEVIPSN
jgi:hypothetical protein